MKNIFSGFPMILKKYWIFISLCIVSFGAYQFYLKSAQQIDYQLFDFSKTVSWVNSTDGIFRVDAHRDFDIFLLSRDNWREYDIQFTVFNARDCLFVTNYIDSKSFYYIYFNRSQGGIFMGFNKEGALYSVKEIPFEPHPRLPCRVKRSSNQVEFYIGTNLAGRMSLPDDLPVGKMGLAIKDNQLPPTVFRDILATGKLDNGMTIDMSSSMIGRQIKFALSGSLLILILVVVAIVLVQVYARNRSLAPPMLKAEWIDHAINNWIVAGIHALAVLIIFWPFIRYGKILVSSSDNYGEIFPLFFYCKHNFQQIISGQSLCLWTSLPHNGMPFYSNHWNMIYYPFNWIMFLFPDEMLMQALTFRTMMEVFLIGVISYKFFHLELGVKRWALFCSIIYQLCSLLIFTFTIFPCISLYFAMTLYLYVLWSMPRRKNVLNFLMLTFSIILILTAANVAFTFYVALSLLIFTIYRCLHVRATAVDKKRMLTVIGLSLFVAFAICTIRIVPCLMGILNSNRIVNNYYTIHDRSTMIARFFVPEIAGWSSGFNALTSPNWNLKFEEMDLPSNSQNTFFAFFGVIPAFLLLLGLCVKLQGPARFWRIYAIVVVLIGLLFQPVWGLFSILFFPLNHYSYHIIIMPVGIAMFCGYMALWMERHHGSLRPWNKRFWAGFLFIQVLILVLLTFLFPDLTKVARGIVFVATLLSAAYFLTTKQQQERKRLFLQNVLLAGVFILWIAIFGIARAYLIKPVPEIFVLSQMALFPFLFLLGVLGTGFYLYVFHRKNGRCNINPLFYVGIILIPVLIEVFLKYFGYQSFYAMEDALRLYFVDVLLSITKVLWLAVIVGLGFILYRSGRLGLGLTLSLMIIITFADLILFNLRFNNVVAPPPYRNAYYMSKFPYYDIDPKLREGMDLVNYRCDGLNQVTLSSNKSLIFNIPTYSGIMGYMPKRFSTFISQFGYSPQTILIYPKDMSDNQRFLDLSSVRYRFVDGNGTAIRQTALSRLTLFYNYENVNDDNRTLERLKNPDFNPLGSVLISGDVPENFAPPINAPSDFVSILNASSDDIYSKVNNGHDAVLLFNESFDGGWNAYVDGIKTKVFPANYNFMGIYLPKGNHDIEFRYEPPLFFTSAKISILGLLGFIVIVIIYLVKPRRWQRSVKPLKV